MYHCISEKPGTLEKQIMTLPDEQLTVSNGKKSLYNFILYDTLIFDDKDCLTLELFNSLFSG